MNKIITGIITFFPFIIFFKQTQLLGNYSLCFCCNWTFNHGAKNAPVIHKSKILISPLKYIKEILYKKTLNKTCFKGTLKGFLTLLLFPPVSNILPLLHAHFTQELIVPEGKVFEAWENSNNYLFGKCGSNRYRRSFTFHISISDKR
jgi:hypothetical protein